MIARARKYLSQTFVALCLHLRTLMSVDKMAENVVRDGNKLYLVYQHVKYPFFIKYPLMVSLVFSHFYVYLSLKLLQS